MHVYLYVCFHCCCIIIVGTNGEPAMVNMTKAAVSKASSNQNAKPKSDVELMVEVRFFI